MVQLLGAVMALTISSPVFEVGKPIPAQYTCQGLDISPPIKWSGVDSSAKSLALIVDDPDAPDPNASTMVYVHWVLYNLPISSTGLPEKVSAADLPAGTLQGKNDWGRVGYGGPCPPIGQHRYFFKLYALDCVLPDLHEPTKAELLRAMEGHIIQEAQWMGTYEKHL